MEHKEIEVRFLEIDKNALITRLEQLGAEDYGEELLEEVIIYDKELTWIEDRKKFIRLRTQGGQTMLAYKYRKDQTAEGTEEIEFQVGNAELAEEFLSRIGFVACRHQQKKRHTFHLGEVVIDIDTWPRIPTYVELEGPSLESLTDAAVSLGLDWKNVELRNPRMVIEEKYHIPLGTIRWFTFDKCE